MLRRGWPGVFRKHLLEELPVERVARRLHGTMGRPSKELYAVVGALVLQQALDLTDVQTCEAVAFDTRWHYALDIAGESDGEKYVCERTLRGYRKQLVDEGLDGELFAGLTGKLLEAFQVDAGSQRLDSLAVRSNMRKLNRLGLFFASIRRFLRSLRRRERELFDAVVPAGFSERYLGGGGRRFFSEVKPSESRRELQRMAEDLLFLVEAFRGDERVNALPGFEALERLLAEQCEVVEGEGGGGRVGLREAREVSPDSLQNPSDPDATYNRHKGQGYSVQIMESYSAEDSEGASGKPDLITHVSVGPVHEADAGALLPALEETRLRGCAPDLLLADASYGGDDNAQAAEAAGVELVSPVHGGGPARCDLGLKSFSIDEAGAQVLSCPAGRKPERLAGSPGEGKYSAYFRREECAACPELRRCPVQLKAGSAYLHYTDKDLRIARRRAVEETDEFCEKYRWRAGIEGSISRLRSQTGARRLRVRGMAGVRFAVTLKALGLNILRAARAVAASAGRSGSPRGAVLEGASARNVIILLLLHAVRRSWASLRPQNAMQNMLSHQYAN
jgi:hypothetical protein